MSNYKPKPKPKRTALIGGIIFVSLILILIFGLIFWWVSSVFDKQGRALEAGCTIESFNSWGMATSYMCPEGYEVK